MLVGNGMFKNWTICYCLLTKNRSFPSLSILGIFQIIADGFLDKKGVYSVKRGYTLAVENMRADKDLSCSSESQQNWWQVVWNLNIPSKIKIFVWSAYMEAFPAKATLVHRKILTNNSCDV